MSAEIIPLFSPNRLTPERRRFIQERVADLALEIALLQSEQERLQSLLTDD